MRTTCILVLCLGIGACGDEVPSATDAGLDGGSSMASDAGLAPRPPPGDTVPCRLLLPIDAVEGGDVHCVDVPGSDGGDVSVHATVFDATLPALPVYVLMGGPALRGAAYVPHLDAATRLVRFGARPVVYVEQRGVGVSEPALRCNAGEDLAACAQRLRDGGLDLGRFDTAHAADDVAAVADRLGHGTFAIAGGSYGSRLGLEVLRRHGGRVARAYLSSLVAPDDDFLRAMVEATGEALDALCEDCATEVLARAGERARTAPPASSFGPLGEALLGFAVFEALYHQDLAATLPGTLDAFASGRVDGVDGLEAALGRPPQVDRLAYQAVLCADLAPHFDAEAYADAAAEAPATLGPLLASIGATFDGCAALGIAPGPAESRTPVVSDVPTLLVAPGLDGRTPASAAARVAATLSAARTLVLPGRVHTPALGYQLEGRPIDVCAGSVLRAFLDDPAGELPTCDAL